MATRSAERVSRFCVRGTLRREIRGTTAACRRPAFVSTRRMQDAGNVLTYVYDYGDNWKLTLSLEAPVVG